MKPRLHTLILFALLQALATEKIYSYPQISAEEKQRKLQARIYREGGIIAKDLMIFDIKLNKDPYGLYFFSFTGDFSALYYRCKVCDPGQKNCIVQKTIKNRT